jgi:predicted SprT family Zn-dependent metalloprotease
VKALNWKKIFKRVIGRRVEKLVRLEKKNRMIKTHLYNSKIAKTSQKLGIRKRAFKNRVEKLQLIVKTITT